MAGRSRGADCAHCRVAGRGAVRMKKGGSQGGMAENKRHRCIGKGRGLVQVFVLVLMLVWYA